MAKEGVPFLFHGVLEACGVPSISFGTEYLIPKPLDPRIISCEAPAVAEAAMDLAPILVLDDSEREFIDRLQAGDLRLEFLVPEDAEMRERLEKWPPLQWKALNARKPRPLRRGDPDAAGNSPEQE